MMGTAHTIQQKSDPLDVSLEYLWGRKRRLGFPNHMLPTTGVGVDVVVGGGIRGHGSHPVFGWTLLRGNGGSGSIRSDHEILKPVVLV